MQPTLLHIETRTKFHFVQPPPYHLLHLCKTPKKKKSLKIFLGMIDKFCCNFYCSTNQFDQTHVSGLLEVNILAAFRLTKLTILIHYLWCVFVEPMLRIWIKVAWWVSVSMYCSDCQADDLKNKWESWVPLKLKESSSPSNLAY